MAEPSAARLLKIVGITLGVLVAVVVVFLVAVWLFVNPNAYKGRIEQTVQHSTGRTLALPGDLKLSVFPSISLELGPASLGNPPGFGAEPFASLQHASLQVRLLPLLHKQLQIGHVEVDGLDLRLKTNAQGQGNWEMSSAATSSPPASTSSASGQSELPEVAGITIKNARFSYQDEVADRVSLNVGRIAPGATVPVSFKLDLKRTPAAQPIALRGQFDLTLGAEAYRLGALKAQLDSTALRGDASVGRSPAAPISFDLALDHIDLDRYLGSAQSSAPPSATPAAASTASAPTELPTDSLKTLQLQGKLTIGNARFHGLTISEVNVGLQASHGLLHIDPIAASLYGGHASGSITVDARPALPRVSLEQSIGNVNMQPLMSDLMHTQKLSGRGNVTLSLTGQGKTSEALIRGLSGRLAANLTNGALIGVDLWAEVQRATALFQRQSPTAIKDSGQTRFDTFKASADVAQGVATTKDLTISSQDLRVTGEGTANLATEAINYHLQAAILKGAASSGATSGALLTVPFDVTGTLSNFKVRPDLAGLAKSNLNKLNKQQLEHKLPGLLKGLLGH